MLKEFATFIGMSVWFFLPAIIGNQFPGFAVWLFARAGKTHWNRAVSPRLLGANKTWPAYPAAMLGATLTIYSQRFWETESLIDYRRADLWLLGILFGGGIVAGDHVKSFFKRRIGIPPGARWWPFDQLDFVAGGLLTVSLVLGWKVWGTALVLVPLVLLFNPLINGLGYKLGLRKVPY